MVITNVVRSTYMFYIFRRHWGALESVMELKLPTDFGCVQIDFLESILVKLYCYIKPHFLNVLVKIKMQLFYYRLTFTGDSPVFFCLHIKQMLIITILKWHRPLTESKRTDWRSEFGYSESNFGQYEFVFCFMGNKQFCLRPHNESA